MCSTVKWLQGNAFFLALSKVSGQDDGGHSTGLLAGVAVAGVLVAVVVLVVGVFCVLKVRVHSKSVSLQTSNNIGFGKHDSSSSIDSY